MDRVSYTGSGHEAASTHPHLETTRFRGMDRAGVDCLAPLPCVLSNPAAATARIEHRLVLDAIPLPFEVVLREGLVECFALEFRCIDDRAD
jgi:hypothetical protein